jgi:hypothetical protein
MRLVLASMLMLMSGCAAAGVVMYKLAGPEAVPAKYVPAQRPMLVLVENYQRQSSASVGADLLARNLFYELSAENVAPLTPLEQLQQLREERPDFSKMSIIALGKAMGAEQVLYVQLIGDHVTPLAGGNTLEGRTHVRVKVVDVVSGETLWPTDLSDGYELAAATELGADSGHDVRDVRRSLYSSLADQIAKLFYKWKPEE